MPQSVKGAVLDDDYYIGEALKEAGKAARKGEVPIGAVIVRKGRVIARGHNTKETRLDPTHHAEMIAIKKAAKRLKGWRLPGTALYATLEPCVMCMGAVIQARIPLVVFAAFDPKAGACGSVFDLSNDKRLNHRVALRHGERGDEARAMLKAFFKSLRKTKNKDVKRLNKEEG